MFPAMDADEGQYYAKPMNCPFHTLILSELGTVYRHERSGTLHGLLRARGLTQDDSHIFCRPDQVIDELIGVIDFLRDLYSSFGLSPDRVRFATRPDKSVGTDEQWEEAERAIPEALGRSGIEFEVDAGDGTFYGPKIDVDARDAIGRYWQLSTIQVDFQTPDRFGIEYVDEHGNRQRPVMVHRALYGSVERWVGVLVEHFAGAFPTWLAPLQAALIPIADRHSEYANDVASRLRAAGVRTEVDDSDDTMGARIRRRQLLKVPYMLVVGDREVESNSVSVRRRTGEETPGVSVDDFVERISNEIAERRVELSI
jgi:threonyl-tRNA synthetase